MAKWVYIVNGKIEEYHDKLPKSWRHISGLDKADLPFLKSQGWFPVVVDNPSYDSTTHKTDGVTYDIQAGEVVERIKVVPLSKEEIKNNKDRAMEDFLAGLKEERNRRLQECDWTQLVDIQECKNSDWIRKWKLYRQALRDLPDKYKNTTDVTIEWPQKPEE